MRVLFSGGGTAGHINPALAMAGYFCEQDPDTQVLYVGNKGGMEERLVPKAGYAFRSIRISGFQRKLSLENIKRNLQTVVRVFTASAEAKKIIKEFKPDICIGTGGYVCGPVIRAAQKLGIPTAVHEANAYPGMTIKMLAGKADSVMLAVEDAKQYLERKDNCEFTGNPVRLTVLGAEREASRKALGLDERPLVLSFGGSLGAEAINNAAAYMLGQSAKEKKFQHIHGYGRHDEHFLDNVRAAGVVEAENPQIRTLEYIDNMPECLAAADLVIARCGAITLTEIEATGKCSVLIPSPNVAENHQFHNAMALVNRDAAVLIEEKDLSGEKLWETVNEILSTPGRAEAIGRNAKAMAVLDANERIYRIVKRILKEKGKA
ncbi:MAG: undecaprenyldiphospho-muramoylpentapeptide beta-N-acetylglucosaminyltransferase [Clostridia bacterium]|nr:undecaprenyldiphospho-muramoylpentapeptide beta-N-acetylglucosaminyltransferase [Clostridia bacterium]